jgi:hypothetical protein
VALIGIASFQSFLQENWTGPPALAAAESFLHRDFVEVLLRSVEIASWFLNWLLDGQRLWYLFCFRWRGLAEIILIIASFHPCTGS